MAVKHGPCLMIRGEGGGRIQAFEFTCPRKLLRISRLEHKTNNWMRSKISSFMGPQEPLLAPVKKFETCMVRACHTLQHPPQNQPPGHLGGGPRRGRHEKCWIDNIKKWTSLPMPELPTRASCRKDWKRISAESFPMSFRRPIRSRD